MYYILSTYVLNVQYIILTVNIQIIHNKSQALIFPNHPKITKKGAEPKPYTFFSELVIGELVIVYK